MKAAGTRPQPALEAAGQRLGEELEVLGCVVVVGERPVDAARVAVGIARGQARHRRVALVDVVGELAPIERLAAGDSRHGVIDYFLYGVSLGRIAQPVRDEPELFVVPSGVGPFDYGTLLRRERWRRLTMAFRNADALMVAVLPATATGLAPFVEDTDGIVLVGSVDYPQPRHVLATVPRDASVAPPKRSERPSIPPSTRPVGEASERRRRAALSAAGVGAIVLAGTLWTTTRGESRTPDAVTPGIARADSPTRDSLYGQLVAEQADSTAVAAYAVFTDTHYMSRADAADAVDARLADVPAATYAPVPLGADNGRAFRAFAGAYRDSSSADSLLGALRAAGRFAPGAGSVRRVPFGAIIARGLTVDSARARVVELRADRLPAYALDRGDGTATVYAGAFETPSQAFLLLRLLKDAGVDASVGYRIGSAF